MKYLFIVFSILISTPLIGSAEEIKSNVIQEDAIALKTSDELSLEPITAETNPEIKCLGQDHIKSEAHLSAKKDFLTKMAMKGVENMSSDDSGKFCKLTNHKTN
jgi:hypothetical protein